MALKLPANRVDSYAGSASSRLAGSGMRFNVRPLTIVADNLYRLLARKLNRYDTHRGPGQAQVGNPRSITLAGYDCVVSSRFPVPVAAAPAISSRADQRGGSEVRLP